MKTLPAILASLTITIVIAFAMVAIGANALFNKNTVPIVDAASSDAPTSSIIQSADQTQPEQPQSLIQQYQDREKQYQAQLQELSQRLQEANQQLQQANQVAQQDGQAVQTLQQVLIELQQRGVIRITNDGQIIVMAHEGGD